MIDTNVTLFQWPFRRLRSDDPAALADKLAAAGVQRAWAGSFEALLHRDIAGVNARLAEACRRHPIFVPFGVVNPTLPDWEEDLRRCREVHGLRGLRLYPNYHGYTLADPVAARLLRLAAEQRLLVQIAVIMEDERTLHPLLRVPPVDVTPLPPLLREISGLRIMLVNAFRTVRLEEAKRLSAAGDISFEISMLEGAGGVGSLLAQVPIERLLFGSHAPLFYFESAVLKLQEAALTAEQRKIITETNAQRLLA